ncbi:hypothetical protein BGZ63DRAFT_404587 [Mariannaea sp. PMI_226]|nr:hypothetical protein BGZ63DRAFT_404587 [Mariannaea sp. PMI_226]
MQFITVAAAFATLFASTATATPAGPKPATEAVANIVAVNQSGSTQIKTQVKVPFGKLTHVDASITELQLQSISVVVPDTATPDIKTITCQMYKDQYGVVPGSARFTSTRPAKVSTNPVSLGWILCYVNPTA